MKYLKPLGLIVLALILMAATTVTIVTYNQMNKVADRLVVSYQYGAAHQNSTSVNLSDVIGNSLANAVMPYDTSYAETDSLRYTYGCQNRAPYQSWVRFALQNRSQFISWFTPKMAKKFWLMVDDSAIQKGMSFQERNDMFLEIGQAVLYYKKALKALSLQEDLTILFDDVSAFGTRNKAYQLQNACYRAENSGFDYQSLGDSLPILQSYLSVQQQMNAMGVPVTRECKDFRGYLFTRNSMQYDYLLAILRWTNKLNGEEEAYKKETLNALVNDGVSLSEAAYNGLNAYTIQQ